MITSDVNTEPLFIKALVIYASMKTSFKTLDFPLKGWKFSSKYNHAPAIWTECDLCHCSYFCFWNAAALQASATILQEAAIAEQKVF